MNPLETFPGQLLACLILGAACALALFILILLGKAWRHAWAWIDDSEPGRNPALELLAKIRGWTKYDSSSGYSPLLKWKDQKGVIQDEPVFGLMPYPFFAPIAAFFCFKFYPVFLSGLVLLVVAFLARFARRHKKLFDKHIKDPDAHK